MPPMNNYRFGTSQPIRILVIDDDEEFCKLVRTSLSRADDKMYRIDLATSYDAGVEAMQRGEHDVYLVDYLLGQHSGINLIRAGIEQGCYEPKILMTAAGNRDIDIQAMEAGAAEYVEKESLTPQALERTIRHVLLRARDEQEIARINEELRQKNEEMSQYVHTVSHDLKSPIVTLMGYVGHLRRDISSERYDRVTMCLERIDAASQRMMRNIEDLLELSRAGRATDDVERVDVTQAIRDILEERDTAIKEKQVTIRVQQDLPSVVADHHRVRLIFDNLIGNALKYGCDNDEPTIEIGSEMTIDEVRYYVSDNGAGIDPANHQVMFGLFQRLSQQSNGSGIGLAIVKRIAEVYNGRVWVESDIGEGATFWVALPNRELPEAYMTAA